MTAPCTLTGTYPYDRNVVVMWLPTIANVQIPTSSEIVSGTDLGPYNLTDIIGWEINSETIRDDIWGPFEGQRIGRQSIAESQLIFAADRSGLYPDIRSLLTRGQPGFVGIFPSGPYVSYPSSPVNIYPVRVSQLTQQQRLRTGDGSLILTYFVVTGLCGENVTVTP